MERLGLRLHFGTVNSQAGRNAVLRDGRERRDALQHRSCHAGADRHRRRDADDGAVHRDQDGEPRYAALLPHGRLLRAVLPRCRGGEPRAGHCAHPSRQASRPRHPDVRGADPCRRRLPAEADRARPSRRRVRADRGPGGGPQARRQVGRAARRRSPRHAWHHHGGSTAGPLGGQLSDGARPGEGCRRRRLRPGLDRHLDGRLPGRRDGPRQARRRRHARRPQGARRRRAGFPRPRAQARLRPSRPHRSPGAAEPLRIRPRRPPASLASMASPRPTASAPSRAPSSRPSRGPSRMSRRRRRPSDRRWNDPPARTLPPPCSSTRRRGPIWSCCAPFRAAATAPC